MPNQQSVPADVIERLKAEFQSDTRGLVKAVASQMILAGDWPATLRLRELIGRGSMNTINAALKEWKATMLGKMRARVEVPDVPEGLVPVFQSALQGLWDQACTEAKAGFDDQRQAAEKTVHESEERSASLAARVEELEAANTATTSELAAARAQIDRLGFDLSDEQQNHRETAATLEAERVAHADEKSRLETMAQREADKHAAVMDSLAAERRHEREALEERLAFAAKQAEDAREKAASTGAAYDRECNRADRLERESREAEAAYTKANKTLRDKLDTALAEIHKAQALAADESKERARAAEKASAALAEASTRSDALASTLRELEEAKRRADAAAAATTRKAGRLLRKIEGRITTHPERPIEPDTALFEELVAMADEFEPR